MSRINRDFWRNSGIRIPGTLKRSDVDLKRYGVGGLDEIVYATTFLNKLDSDAMLCSTRHTLGERCTALPPSGLQSKSGLAQPVQQALAQ